MAILEPNGKLWFILESVALEMLGRYKISFLTNSIQMCVDSKLNKYEVPVFCINEPTKYSNVKSGDKNLQL